MSVIQPSRGRATQGAAPGSIIEIGEFMPVEKQVEVTLNERQHLGGVWHAAGDTVTVYESEAYALAKRGKIDAKPEELAASSEFLADPHPTTVETAEDSGAKKSSARSEARSSAKKK